ncbi:MAG: hypothetical protein ACI8QS_003604 [Planctomycetota bacterium]|jgi:hypothetical protein
MALELIPAELGQQETLAPATTQLELHPFPRAQHKPAPFSIKTPLGMPTWSTYSPTFLPSLLLIVVPSYVGRPTGRVQDGVKND